MQLILILIAISIASCSTSALLEDKSISIARLLEDSKTFEGKPVEITGYLNWEMEDFSLYANLADLNSGDSNKSLWLETPPNFDASSLHRKHVKVVGIYSKNEVGHMSMWPGGIRVKSIRAIEK